MSVSFENFKSFKDRVDLNLNRVNYLIGPNGAGKSNVFAGMNLISDVLRNDAVPKPEDSFDRATGAPVILSFTVEMPEDEKRNLSQKMSHRAGTEDLPTPETLRHLKYEVSFLDQQRIQRKIWLSDPSGQLQVVRDLYLEDGNYKLFDHHIVRPGLKYMRNMHSSEQPSEDVPNRDFFSIFGVRLLNPVIEMFSLELVGSRREFPGSATASQDIGVSATGDNLPNQLATMYNDPAQRQAFGDKIGALSSGEIEGANTSLQETNLAIELKERGRNSATTYAEISSGHHQELILAHFFHRRKAPIIMIEEPELHLHAADQKNLLKDLRDGLGDGQLIIATHSPIFANVSDAESTFLLSKQDGMTSAVPISESNVRLIRSKMGIGHEDALDSGYLCCVEGSSEKIAIPALARKLGYRVGLSPWVLDLKGYGNSKHLELLLEYLGMSEKKSFVLLDKNGRARKHVGRLLNKGLFAEGQCHFLQGNFEDLFPSSMLIKYSRQLAQKHGVAFELSEDELERRRRDCSVTDILEEEWQKQSSAPYPKVEFAELIASMRPGDMPDEAAAVVRRIMEALGVELA